MDRTEGSNVVWFFLYLLSLYVNIYLILPNLQFSIKDILFLLRLVLTKLKSNFSVHILIIAKVG